MTNASDPGILSRIGDLIDSERELRSKHQGSALTEVELEQLKNLEVELDQCWDLLNQRRALREFGRDPDQARVRDESTVEQYQQ